MTDIALLVAFTLATYLAAYLLIKHLNKKLED